MKFLRAFLFLSLTIFFILTLHIFVINFLSFPYNHIHIVFSCLFFLFTIRPSRQVLWITIITAYFFELFSGTPFGIGQAALIFSLLTIHWFQFNILTNRAVHIIFISSVLGMIFYRLLYFGLLFVYNYFATHPTWPSREVIADIAWEIFFSSFFVSLLYFVYSKFLKSFRKQIRLSSY